MVRSHLTLVESGASTFASRPAFKVPVRDPASGALQQWRSISYAEFYSDMIKFSRYWSRRLGDAGVPAGSIVGIWVGGFTYNDLLLIYSISRAGFIPQLTSLRLPDPTIVFELLKRSQAKALVYDPSFENSLVNCPVHSYMAVALSEVQVPDGPDPALPVVSPDDAAFYFHTSGSTSGSPKVVPYSYRWLDVAIRKAGQIMKPRNPERQDVTSWMGSVCHVATSYFLLGSLQHGSCTIQPTSMAYDQEEFVSMVQTGRLNRLHQFGASLAARIRAAKQDPKLLSMLQGLDEALYTGLSIPNEDSDFAYKNGINLFTVFGSTECGIMLISNGGAGADASLLRPIEADSYIFSPITSSEGHQSTAQLLELVVDGKAGDCPHPAFRAADGHFHTGDLFQETRPGSGLYIYRGRDDDWIKSENALRCDTKAIEDNVRLTCGSLISECVVVGAGRPSPTLFVEPSTDMDYEKLKKEIIRKTRQFHSRRYLHERITLTRNIVVVPSGTLPRTSTKGNVRRKAVEELFKAQLDAIYA